MNELQQKLAEASRILSKLHEIKRSQGRYFLTDLSNWLDRDLDQLGCVIDEAHNLAEHEYPDQQLILNFEHEGVTV